jgi:hypothetical protein
METYGSLEVWLRKMARRRKSDFPGVGSQDYVLRYERIADHARTEIHKLVVVGANLIDGGHLTDHGVDHIRTVLDRAAQLIQAPACKLTAYEVYLLLVAIHFHDVGNIFGRENHASRAGEILKSLHELAGNDTPEKRRISQIAEAHGPTRNGSKDTISALPTQEDVLGKPVRLQLLAAILRFADELADDSFRASRFFLKEGLVPKESEVFHQYAAALHSVSIDLEGRQVRLKFELDESSTERKFGKQDTEVYLLEEIFERSLKMHLERIYCMRYMRAQIPIDVLQVDIVVYSSSTWRELVRLQYRLEESGYPEALAGLSCKQLTGFTGEELKDSINDKLVTS